MNWKYSKQFVVVVYFSGIVHEYVSKDEEIGWMQSVEFLFNWRESELMEM